jgi:AcrR family transcriptional regulator
MARGDIPTRILDAAELLFAQRGYHGVSMRQVAEGAGVSVSLAQYHFVTKEALFGSVMERRILAINHQRLARLDSVEREGLRSGKIELEDVLRAFLEPTVLLSRDKASGGSHYAQLISQLTNDPQPHARAISRAYNDPIARQTMRVLQLTLPELDSATLTWCYLFAVGSMITAISSTGRVRELSNGQCDPDDVSAIMEVLVPFLAGAFPNVAVLARAGKFSASRMPLPVPQGAATPKASGKESPAPKAASKRQRQSSGKTSPPIS